MVEFVDGRISGEIEFTADCCEVDLTTIQHDARHEVTLSLPVVRWEYPYDRFVQYGPEDKEWARRLGFGREVQGIDVLVFPNCYISRDAGGTIVIETGQEGDLG